jgi:hypothetical protein
MIKGHFVVAKIAYPFLLLASIGFVGIVAIHVTTLFGMTHLFEQSLRFIVPGLFVVWLPTVLIMSRLTRDFKQKDLWRAALRGCPEWMRKAQWLLVGYASIGCVALPLIYGGGMDMTANKARSMTAVLLSFYSIATTVLYSATRAERSDVSRRCLNGHRVSALAKYCEECGAQVRTGPPVSDSLA